MWVVVHRSFANASPAVAVHEDEDEEDQRRLLRERADGHVHLFSVNL